MVKYCRPVRLLSIFLMLSAAALPPLASAEEGPANLTLRQAIKMAVEKNLDEIGRVVEDHQDEIA